MDAQHKETLSKIIQYAQAVVVHSRALASAAEKAKTRPGQSHAAELVSTCEAFAKMMDAASRMELPVSAAVVTQAETGCAQIERKYRLVVESENDVADTTSARQFEGTADLFKRDFELLRAFAASFRASA